MPIQKIILDYDVIMASQTQLSLFPISLSSHTQDLMVSTATLLGVSYEWDSMEKKPTSLLDIFWEKTLSGIHYVLVIERWHTKQSIGNDSYVCPKASTQHDLIHIN